MNVKFNIIKTFVSKLGTKTLNAIKHEQPTQILKQAKQVLCLRLFSQ